MPKINERECLEILKKAEENGMWLSENYSEIEKKYENRIIAIKEQKIIAYADTVEELLEKLEEEDLRFILITSIPSRKFASIL
jgi:ABC-type multidrug transport system ATPase subunit